MSLDVKPVNLTLAIALRYLGNETKAIEEKLNSYKSHYIPEADGILVGWNQLKVLNKEGMLIDDSPFVFWKVKFVAKVFRAIEGKLVIGQINQILRHYFIARAMDSFSVTVSIPEHLLDTPVVKSLMLEQEVYFKIKGNYNGVYRGEVDEQSLELTSSIAKPDVAEENVYDYAKEFEY